MDMVEKMIGLGEKGERRGTGHTEAEGNGEDTQQAIQKLKETEKRLNKKTEFLEKKLDKELQTAKKNGTKNKRVALNALKRKKRLERQLQQIDGTLSTIEFQREALENAQTNTEILKNMSYAAEALKAAHQHLNADDVHDTMDDIAEQNEIAQEISDAFVPAGQEFDEDELIAELEELEESELEKQLQEVGQTPSVAVEDPSELQLPEVPAHDVPRSRKKRATEEDDDVHGSRHSQCCTCFL